MFGVFIELLEPVGLWFCQIWKSFGHYFFIFRDSSYTCISLLEIAPQLSGAHAFKILLSLCVSVWLDSVVAVFRFTVLFFFDVLSADQPI